MKKLFTALLLFLLLGTPAVLATTLSGTIKDTGGTPITGSLWFELSQNANVLSSGGCGGPYAVGPGNPVVFILTNGAITGPGAGPYSVVGNDCISPANTFYHLTAINSDSTFALRRDASITGASVDIGTLPVPGGGGGGGGGGFTTLLGDVTGTNNASVVSKFQGVSLAGSMATPTTGYGIVYNGSQWAPAVVTAALMTGATPSTPGTAGTVPAPAAGQQNFVLTGAAAWAAPGTGTVTSLAQGTGMSLTPSTITTSGTIALTTPVSLTNGGTGANLSATGGTGQYLKQSSVGAALTVGTIPVADLSGVIKADGSVPLTATWNAGNYRIDSRNSTAWFNIKAYGAIADTQVAGDGAMTIGSYTLTSASATFAVGDVGKLILVTKVGAAGVVLATTIAGFGDAHTVTLTLPNASGSGQTACTVNWGTNNSTAIASTITAAMVNGGTVEMPWGNFMIGSAIQILGASGFGLVIRGEGGTYWGAGVGARGTQLLWAGASGSEMIYVKNFQNLQIDSLSLDGGNVSNSTAILFDNDGTAGATTLNAIRNAVIKHTTHGIAVGSLVGAAPNTHQIDTLTLDKISFYESTDTAIGAAIFLNCPNFIGNQFSNLMFFQWRYGIWVCGDASNVGGGFSLSNGVGGANGAITMDLIYCNHTHNIITIDSSEVENFGAGGHFLFIDSTSNSNPTWPITIRNSNTNTMQISRQTILTTQNCSHYGAITFANEASSYTSINDSFVGGGSIVVGSSGTTVSVLDSARLGINTIPLSTHAVDIAKTADVGVASGGLYVNVTRADADTHTTAGIVGTVTATHTAGTEAAINGTGGSVNATGSGGTTTTARAVYGSSNIATGAIATNLYRFHALEDVGAGTIGTNVGLYVDSLTRGATNYSIYTAGTTPSYFGGQILVGDGAVAAASIGRAAQPNTGLWFGSSAMLFDLNGQDVMSAWVDHVIVRSDGFFGFGNPDANSYTTFFGTPSAGVLKFGGYDAASPPAQTLTVSGVIAGTADTAGTVLTVQGSTSTGSGRGGPIAIQTAYPGAASTTQNTLSTRDYVPSGWTTLTESSPTAIATLTFAASTAVAAMFVVTVEAADATDRQSMSYQVQVNAVRKATGNTVSLSAIIGTPPAVASTSATTLTCSFTTTDGASAAVLNANCVSSLTQTLFRATWQARTNGPGVTISQN